MRAGVYFCMGSLRAASWFVKETTRFPRRAKEGKGGQRRAKEGKGGQRYQSNGIACKSTEP